MQYFIWWWWWWIWPLLYSHGMRGIAATKLWMMWQPHCNISFSLNRAYIIPIRISTWITYYVHQTVPQWLIASMCANWVHCCMHSFSIGPEYELTTQFCDIPHHFMRSPFTSMYIYISNDMHCNAMYEYQSKRNFPIHLC